VLVPHEQAADVALQDAEPASLRPVAGKIENLNPAELTARSWLSLVCWELGWAIDYQQVRTAAAVALDGHNIEKDVALPLQPVTVGLLCNNEVSLSASTLSLQVLANSLGFRLALEPLASAWRVRPWEPDGALQSAVARRDRVLKARTAWLRFTKVHGLEGRIRLQMMVDRSKVGRAGLPTLEPGDVDQWCERSPRKLVTRA